MAHDDNNKNSGVTAGDLHGKLNRIRQNADEGERAIRAAEQDAIDATTTAESDGDLDLNELLQRYMADYDDGQKNEESTESTESVEEAFGGVLDGIRKQESLAEELLSDEDEKLISALDSAFSLPSEVKTEAADDVTDISFADLFQHARPNTAETAEEPTDNEPLTFPDRDEAVKVYEDEPAEQIAADEPLYEDDGETMPVDEKKPSGGKLKKFFGWFFAANDEDDDEEEELIEDDGGEDLVIDRIEETEPYEAAAPIEQPIKPQPVEVVQNPAAETTTDETDDEELLRRAMEMLTSSAAQKPIMDAEQTAEMAEQAETTDAADMVEMDFNGVETDSEIDPTDINLMVAFGMDEDGKDKTGHAKELGDKLQAHQEAQNKKQKLDRAEFVDKSQIGEIRKEFISKEKSLWIRLVLCAVFTVLLMLFENVGLLTKLFTGTAKEFAGVFDPAVYPTVYIMTSLQLMLLACVCALDRIVYAVKNFIHGVLKPELLTVILTLVGIIFSVASARLTVAPNEPVTFNFVTALAALLTLVCALIDNRRESMSFRVVSDKRAKHIVRRLNDEEARGETAAFADADDVSDVMKIETTDFVDNFFARLKRPDAATGTAVMVILGVSVAAALLFTLFACLRGVSGALGWQVFYESLLILAPFAVFLTFAYPFYRASASAKAYDSAIIGETSLDEYANASVISFDDKNVFPSYSVKVQNIHICNNARIDRVFYYAASVFSYAGGPLQDVFELATQNVETSKNVELFDIEEGFLATQVDGVNIIFGSREDLLRRGFVVSEEEAADDDYFAEELEIMYMFREDKLIAKMYMQYVMDPDIDLILKQFSGNGLYVCVRTFDPNISEKMIARKLNMEKIPLRIVRYTSRDEVSVYEEKADSGLVTCGTPKSLLQIISYCGNVLHTRKTNVALNILSLLIGAAILLLLLLTGALGTQYSLFVALYQLVWLIPAVISTRMFVR